MLSSALQKQHLVCPLNFLLTKLSFVKITPPFKYYIKILNFRWTLTSQAKHLAGTYTSQKIIDHCTPMGQICASLDVVGQPKEKQRQWRNQRVLSPTIPMDPMEPPPSLSTHRHTQTIFNYECAREKRKGEKEEEKNEPHLYLYSRFAIEQRGMQPNNKKRVICKG